MMRKALSTALIVGLLLPGIALGQATTAPPTTTTGSQGCATLAQASADAIAAQIAADNQTIVAPQSVTTLTCLNNFFSGVGLDVVTNLLDPTALLNAVVAQICSAVQQTWTSMTSGAGCGLTITGFNFGFGGLGGGLLCPRLSFGGGGPQLGTFGIGPGGSGAGGIAINGQPTAPTGYTVPTVGGLY